MILSAPESLLILYDVKTHFLLLFRVMARREALDQPMAGA